jgi:hypothetical protein
VTGKKGNKQVLDQFFRRAASASQSPAALMITRGSTGEAGVAVALGHGVGTFRVDFFIVVTVFVGVAVVTMVVSVGITLRTA